MATYFKSVSLLSYPTVKNAAGLGVIFSALSNGLLDSDIIGMSRTHVLHTVERTLGFWKDTGSNVAFDNCV
jgi:hypothetical protein